MTFPACARCVIESDGAGRPPAVTIVRGTAVCADHAIKRDRELAALRGELEARRHFAEVTSGFDAASQETGGSSNG